ncbi:BAALC binder of MAP3K1 and KLF4 a isoform X1 [Nerophis ophidion]|uniref:BAALC binder of MAP3K1 and KLF4 a isoform X1 n=1 Tax=Nerophis ophidion TaxID=159077 RepID=UPI002AE0252E|nr:BAALC binder of MAP3K1 and KLF4 a isoform X1 [Nerophis ophidion]
MMGCGGSRAAAVMAGKHEESRTRDTESTWLTNTDLQDYCCPRPLPLNTYVGDVDNKMMMMMMMMMRRAGKAEPKKRMVTTATQCGKQSVGSSSTSCNHQRRQRRSLSDASTKSQEAEVSTADT